jgi:carbon-monoxide dehydrogenase large subunit
MKPFKGRKEDFRFITGRGQYTADWNLPGQLHAAFLRSDRAHAEIRSLSKSAAEKMPGVKLVLAGADLAGKGFKTLPSLVFYPGRGGAKIIQPERLPLAHGRARYVGEAVALVVAETPAQAQDAAEAIEVDYHDLPPVIDVERATANGAPLVYENTPGNVCFDFEYGDEKKTAELFSSAAHVVKLSMDSPRVAPSPMETRAMLAFYDAGVDRYTVRFPNQGAFAAKAALAGMLGVDPSKVRAEFVDVGGAFGARVSPYYEFGAIAHAAKLAGKPVKWVSTRSEDFTNDGAGRAVRLSGELALDKDGRFLALRTKWLADSGAYLCQAGAMTNTSNNKTIAAGPYNVQAVYGRHLQVITNTTPTEAFRGAGRPEAAYIVERLVDEAARQLKIDPIELRRRNAIPREGMPFTSVSGTIYDSADFRALLDGAERESGWKDFPARREAAKRRGKLRGIGCALFVEPSGGGGVPKDQVAVEFKLSSDGNGEIHLFHCSGASGQGHETIFPELVGERLGIDPEKIILRAGDPDGPALIGAPAIGSRTALSQGSAFRIAADEIIRKGLDLAAKDLEASPADIEFRDGRYAVKGTDRGVSLSDLAERHSASSSTPGAKHPLDTLGESPAQRAFPTGAYVCEVEIDPETGESQVAAFTAVDDIGHALSPVMAEGQVVGGVVQSLGHVFGERVAYDPESGQMLTGSFMDYALPRADLLETFRLRDCPVPSPNNILGAKGAGEAGTTGGLPACMNAVLDALRPAGAKALDLPATPDRIWRALNS